MNIFMIFNVIRVDDANDGDLMNCDVDDKDDLDVLL